MKAYLNEHTISFGDINSIIEINKEMEKIDIFLNDFENLSDIEKYNLLTHFFSFYIEDNDLIELSNIINNSHFNKTISIPTKMEYFYITQNPDNSLNKEKFQICLLCATENNFSLKTPKYTYDKIIELIETKKIYPISIETKKINKFSNYHELYTPINTLIPNIISMKKEVWDDNYTFIPTEQNIPLIIKLIENNISKKQLLEDIKFYILKLLNDFDRYKYMCTQEELAIQPILTKFYEIRFN